ncbi:TldD/PmbA family protein [Anaerotignum sp.]|nr:TldD/PmbA family protein [Anaerotignum sp.]MBQ7758206.1 TldD/PmbA family protein [Anaerotignum sp.]
MMKRKEFLDKVLAFGKQEGFAECEVFYRGGKAFEVLILEGEVANYENSKEEGLAFRGNINGRTGYAYTERLTEAAIPFLVETAKENAALLSPEDMEDLYEGEASYPQLEGVNEELEQLKVEDKINAAMRMEQAALAGAEEVASLDYCALGTALAEIAIKNTKGLDVSFAKNFATAYVSAIAKKGEETKTGSYFWKAQDWNDFDPEATGREAAKRAAAHLGASSVPSGKYDIILDGRAMVSLLGAFAGIFFAENVQKGFSLLNEKTGMKIASDKVTLRDDALLEGGYGTRPFDSEGVSGKNKAVIENGVLKTLLYNRKTARKDGVKSTGNGFKAGLTGSVKTGTTNFYLAKGEKSREELFAEMGDGLFITSLMGLHAGTNAVSGDFSLSAEGFRVEDGKIGKPVEQITIAGNFYKLLEGVEELADDLYFGSGGVGSPSVLVRKLDIAGI